MHKYLGLIFGIFCVGAAHADCALGTQTQRALCTGTNTIRVQNFRADLQEDAHLDAMAADYAWRLYLYNGGRGSLLTHDIPGDEFSKRMSEGHVAMPCGENIAGGQQSVNDALTSWRNSPGHFRNMVNPQYHRIGTGYYEGFWVQIFSD